MPAAQDATGIALRETNTEFAKHVPESFRDKPWVKEVLAQEGKDHRVEFFNQFESLQKKLGQRGDIVLPGEGATEEQVKSFHKALGVPDAHTEYKLEPVTFDDADKKYGEYLQAGRPDAFMEDMKQAAHKLGLTPKQFQGMFESHDRAFIKHHRDFVKSQAEAEQNEIAEFEKTASLAFGDRKDKIINDGKELLGKLVPADSPWRAFFMRQTPEQLVGMAYVLNLVNDRFIKEDKGLSAATQAIVSASNPREEAKQLMGNPAYFDQNNPQHDSIRAKVNELYKLAESLGKK